MTRRRTLLFLLFPALLLLPAPIVRAEALTAGSKLEPFSLVDQNDVAHNVDTSVRMIVFTADMDAGTRVKEALSENGSDLLAAAGAVYVSDISRMPAFVTSLFALPALRKRDYPVLLDRDGKRTKDWPHSEGKVTIIDLDAGTVRGIRQESTTAEVGAALRDGA